MSRSRLTDTTLDPVTILDDGTKMPVHIDNDHDLWVRTNKPDALTATNLVNIAHAGMDIREGDTVLDLGAWIGRFARTCFRRKAYRVVSIEGDPNTFRILKLNRELQSFKAVTQQHDLICGVIWSEITELESYRAYMSVDFSANTALHTTVSIPGGNRIWTNKIDFVAAMHLFQPDVIKFDIEGGEYRILNYYPTRKLLRGARDVLVHWHVRNVNDKKQAVALHKSLTEIMGSCIIEPDLRVKIPPNRAYFLHDTVGLYRNDYSDSNVMLATKSTIRKNEHEQQRISSNDRGTGSSR